MARKRVIRDECVYCRQVKVVTREHPVPRCLFPGQLPREMVTVPVCEVCNKAKGPYDEYLRDTLVLDDDASSSPAARELVAGKLTRSVRRNRSRLVREALPRARRVRRRTPSGIYVDEVIEVPIDGEGLARSFAYLVRGLSFQLRGIRLPLDCGFESRRLSSLEYEMIREGMKSIPVNGPYKLGNGVFSAEMIWAAEEPTMSIWWLWFYESICVTVETWPAAEAPNPNRDISRIVRPLWPASRRG